jgi:hypothetical protein
MNFLELIEGLARIAMEVNPLAHIFNNDLINDPKY